MWISRPAVRSLAGTRPACTASGCAPTPQSRSTWKSASPFSGDVVFRSGLAAKNFDYQTVEYTAAVKPAEKANLLHEVVRRQGRNAKQNRVAIERSN